jgi:hypothetical protein
MANPEHVAILRKGWQVWNRWREEHPEIRPDLSGAYLSDIYISAFNLGGVNLSKADLNNIVLRAGCGDGGSDFRGADLTGANLSGAELNSADFTGADLTEANLERAYLPQTNLTKANLSRANLNNTDLSTAYVEQTLFVDVDLSSANGLNVVIHFGPSTIGIDTIIKSHGKIPENFLREAGVPQSVIEQIPALIGSLKAIDYYTCFISHSSKDEEFAKRLHADLQIAGVRCWFAPEDMKIGDRIRPRIDESIRLYDKLLIVLSEHSVVSQWVEHEVETALGKELEGKPNVLFPIRLDEAVMQSRTGWASHIRLTRHIGDFIRWKDHDEYKKAFDRLLRDLKAEA